MPTFEEILAEADATIARVRKVKGKPSKSAVRAQDNPEKNPLYVPSKNVYRFWINQCKHCGTAWNEFDGIYEERRHPSLSHTHWVRLESLPTNDLPRETTYQTVEVPYCKVCANAPA